MSTKKKKEFAQLSAATKDLYQTLCANIRGQDEAIHYFVQGIFKGQFIPDTATQALNNVFLLSGPPGTGKSALAYVTAAAMQRNIIEVNLDVNAAESSADDFVKTVSGSSEAGRISKFVEENPDGILLLKNIEKASPKVVSAISQVIENGSVTDATRNVEISFANTIIIFTTNMGVELYLDETNGAVLPKSVVLQAFGEILAESEFPMLFFYEYFANDHIIFFKPLSPNHIVELIERSFGEFAQEIQEEYGYELELDPDMTNLCLYNQCDIIDAKSVAPLSKAFMKNEFYELSRHLEEDTLTGLEKITFTVETPPEDNPLYNLFMFSSKPQVLVVADQEAYPSLVENDFVDYLFAQNVEQAVEILSDTAISFAVVDLLQDAQDLGFHTLSLDDEVSAGLVLFDFIRENLPTMPVYLAKRENITLADYFTFMQKGARATVDLSADSDRVTAEMLMIARDIHVQKNYDVLEKEGLILTYNTAQKLSADGRQAEIVFYDFDFRSINGPDPMDELLEKVDDDRRFDDIVGGKAAKEELKYLSEYLINPEVFVMKNHSSPCGVLLFGYTDAGKVSLGRALATETGATLLMTTTSRMAALTPEGACEFLKDLFGRAIREAPAVILIEQLDQLLETVGIGAVNAIVNGIKDIRSSGEPVLFVGTLDWGHSTVSDDNSDFPPELLHLLEYKIRVQLPDRDERIEGITRALKARGIDTVPEALIQNIADRVVGQSVADINEFISLAIRMAAKQQKDVDRDILADALGEFHFGQKQEWDEPNYFSTAVHEAGHAYMMWYTGEKSSFVTIVGRGEYGGYTRPKVNEKINKNYTRKYYLDKIRMSLAGRAAEVVFLGEEEGINVGIGSDLQNATTYAMIMVNDVGMGKKLRAYIPWDKLLISPAWADIYEEVNEILQQEYENTLKIIRAGQPAIQALADQLVEKYQLTGPEIDEILDRFPKPASDQEKPSEAERM